MATPAHNLAPRPQTRRGGPREVAADQGNEVADHIRDAAGDVKDTALERAGEVTQEAMDQARDLLLEAREQIDAQASSQAQRLGTSLRRLAEELDDMRRRGETGGPAARLVGEAAELSHQAADFFDGREFGEIVDDVRAFARRRPTGFLLGAAGLGMLVGRLARGTRDAQRQTEHRALPPAAADRISEPIGGNELRTHEDVSARPPARRNTTTGAATGATARRRTTSSAKRAGSGRPTTARTAGTTRGTVRSAAAEPYPAEPTPMRTGSRAGARANGRGGRR